MRTTSISLLAIMGLAASQVAAAPAASLSAAHPGEAGPRRVLVDTDMGLDDVRAVFALLAAEAAEVAGVAVVEGSASAGKGLDNLAGLLEAAGAAELPVFFGQAAEGAGAEPPPWRATANALGGAAFPPPRKIAARRDLGAWLAALRAHETAPIDVLALGPLGNLAAVLRESDGGRDAIAAIWIPAEVDAASGEVSAWNLEWDRASAETVFAEAPRILLIDVSAAKSVDAEEALSALRGESAAVRWIARLLAGTAVPHLALYDDYAVAGYLDEELIALDSETFRLEIGGGSASWIAPDDEGNVRVARIKDASAAACRLAALWQRPLPMHQDHDDHGGRGHGGGPEALGLPIKEYLKAFHGHLGPYVVLGYRMGRLALEATGSEGHFDLSVEVASPLEPPASCLIDGIQLGSGCTLGKRNISVTAAEPPASAVFTARGGKAVTVRLRENVPALVARLVDEKGAEAAGEAVLDMPEGELFEMETPAVKAPR